MRDKTTVQQAVASVSDGGHSRLARHRNRSRCGRYGRFRSCGGVSSAWFPERLTAQSEPCQPRGAITELPSLPAEALITVCQWSGQAWEGHVGRHPARPSLLNGWLAQRTTKALYPPAPAVLTLLAADQD